MPDPIRVGVIGTSWYSDLMHLPNMKSHPHAQLAAICGRNLIRAQDMATKYNIPAVYTDYREMLGKEKLDAAIVVTPDDLHYEMTLAALDAGLHVICEKPLTLNAQDARTLANRAEAAGVKHMTFFTWRWTPHYRCLRALIDEGFIGRPYHCQISYVAGFGRKGDYAWRFDAQHGNGILGDLGSHMIDMARWLVGDISAVSAKLRTLGKRVGPEGQPLTPANDSALLNVQFVNGAYGTISVSAMAHVGERGQHQQVLLFGENGTLEADLTFRGSSIRGIRHDQTQWQTFTLLEAFLAGVPHDLPVLEQFIAALQVQPIGDRLFIDSILADQPVTPNFFDGLRVQEVIDAAYASDRQDCWIPVSQA